MAGQIKGKFVQKNIVCKIFYFILMKISFLCVFDDFEVVLRASKTRFHDTIFRLGEKKNEIVLFVPRLVASYEPNAPVARYIATEMRTEPLCVVCNVRWYPLETFPISYDHVSESCDTFVVSQTFWDGTPSVFATDGCRSALKKFVAFQLFLFLLLAVKKRIAFQSLFRNCFAIRHARYLSTLTRNC